MPVYSYSCPQCSKALEGFNSVDERHTNAPECSECEVKTELVPSVPATPVLNPARPVKKPRSL